MSDSTSDTRDGGEADEEIVELFGVDFDRGLMASDAWLVVGAPCEVRRGQKQGPWSATATGYSRADYVRIAWTLKSGEQRSQMLVVPDIGSLPVGHELEVKGAYGQRWTSTVTEVSPLVAVAVEYVTPSNLATGKKSRRTLYRIGELEYYLVLDGDQAAIVAVPPR